jgi:hypothetical protein
VFVPDKTFLVRLKIPTGAHQRVRAATVKIHGEHLIFFNSEEKLSALYLMENVESWNELL